MDLTNPTFLAGTKIIVARNSPGDLLAYEFLNKTGTVIGHQMPYAVVDFGEDGIHPILERNLERFLG